MGAVRLGVEMASVTTVLGPKSADALGIILPHEHVLCDLTPLDLRDPAIADTPITLANAHAVAYRPNDHKGNHRLTQHEIAQAELAAFAKAGGGTVFELSTIGIAPDPVGLRDLSAATGVAIVAGAGFYTAPFVAPEFRAHDVGYLADFIESQIRVGCAGSDVKAGLIGEVGCSWPLVDFERRSLAASAIAHRRTGVSINVHPGRHPQAPHQILDILAANGADPGCIAISHIDRTYFDYPSMAALAKRGCWLEFDFFGIETSNYWMGVADLPTDWMRLRYIRQAISDGWGDRLLLSHDICTRSRWAAYGGHGYAHLPANVPGLMRDRGFTQAEIAMLMCENPRRFVCGV